jgi:hypothetical protein
MRIQLALARPSTAVGGPIASVIASAIARAWRSLLAVERTN